MREAAGSASIFVGQDGFWVVRYGILVYMSRYWLLTICIALAAPVVAWGQTSLSLPVASTVTIVADEPVAAGSVIRYDEATDIYALSNGLSDSDVYGVVAERPAVVFVTSATAVPVVTQGVTEVLVSMENGPIARGDVLTAASAAGQAMRAGVEERAVFAVALEAADTPGIILAHIGAEQAQATQAQRAAITAEGGIIVSMTRAVIAAVLVLGAIGFLLYSFRSIMTTGVISIGRNPRARKSVLSVSIGSMILAIVLTGLVVFVAIGILILPV